MIKAGKVVSVRRSRITDNIRPSGSAFVLTP